MTENKSTCLACNGKGELFSTTVHLGDDKCTMCNGTGEVIIIKPPYPHNPPSMCKRCGGYTYRTKKQQKAKFKHKIRVVPTEEVLENRCKAYKFIV